MVSVSEPSVSDQQSPPPAASSSEDPAVAAPRPRRSGAGWLALLALLVAIGAAVVAGLLWTRFDGVAQEAARRLQSNDARVEVLADQVKQAQALSRDLQSRSAVLESRLTEVLGQQAQLERMYKDITEESIAAVLADVESMVSLAQQQLSVSGNIRGAIIALQDADSRLERINQPEALGLRRFIGADLERLAAVPTVDVTSLALRLDSIADRVDELALLSSVAAAPDTSAADAAAAAEGQGFSFEKLARSGLKGWEALLDELSQLFHVNRIDKPEALLLAPEQRFFVRENLRLTLLSARLALLARNEQLFHNDLGRAADWLRSYYRTDDQAVRNAITMLEQLKSSQITAELPSLGDTLSAVRAARVARETGGNP